MCSHYRIENLAEAVAIARARAEAAEANFDARVADAWPKAALPVVYQAERRTLGTMRWGVWPAFEPKPRPVVNARDDKLLTSPVWQRSAARQRCLVPADGFYEWAGPAGAKWEALFHLPDSRPFFFAGLWARDPAGEERGFALVTTRPCATVAALPHDRMPVILDDAGATAWLGDRPLPAARLLGLCAPFAGELVRRDRVRAQPLVTEEFRFE